MNDISINVMVYNNLKIQEINRTIISSDKNDSFEDLNLQRNRI